MQRSLAAPRAYIDAGPGAHEHAQRGHHAVKMSAGQLQLNRAPKQGEERCIGLLVGHVDVDGLRRQQRLEGGGVSVLSRSLCRKVQRRLALTRRDARLGASGNECADGRCVASPTGLRQLRLQRSGRRCTRARLRAAHGRRGLE